MTEQEWLTCLDPEKMLRLIANHPNSTERKLRLFTVACYWHDGGTYPLSDAEMDAVENYADGLIGRDELLAAHYAHFRSLFPNDPDSAFGIVEDAFEFAFCEMTRTDKGRVAAPDLHRCIFGTLAFRLVTADPSWAACCRSIWHLLLSESHAHVEVGERYADALVTEQERQATKDQADYLICRLMEIAQEDGQWWGGEENDPAESDARERYRGMLRAIGMDVSAALDAASAVGDVVAGINPFKRSYDPDSHNHAAMAGAHAKAHAKDQSQPLEELESAAQATLLRHLFGDPFRSYPAPGSWPSTVVQLATALYNGQDCSFALHDALLEAGHPELAEHFKDKDHPKGCWALDTILGKK
jgi:hypothetical protein